MTRATRWAGVSHTDRRAERRSLLLEAAFTLFGEGGEAAVSVRSVCRASELNTRGIVVDHSVRLLLCVSDGHK